MVQGQGARAGHGLDRALVIVRGREIAVSIATIRARTSRMRVLRCSAGAVGKAIPRSGRATPNAWTSVISGRSSRVAERQRPQALLRGDDAAAAGGGEYQPAQGPAFGEARHGVPAVATNGEDVVAEGVFREQPGEVGAEVAWPSGARWAARTAGAKARGPRRRRRHHHTVADVRVVPPSRADLGEEDPWMARIVPTGSKCSRGKLYSN